MADDRFLIIGEEGNQQFFLLLSDQEDPKMIIGEGEGFGGSGGIRRKSVGTSLVQQQLGNRPIIHSVGTALGTMIIKDLYNKVHSKLNINIRNNVECVLVEPKIEGTVHAACQIKLVNESIGSIYHKTVASIKGALNIKVEHVALCAVRPKVTAKMELFQLQKEHLSLQKDRKRIILERIESTLVRLETLRKMPKIKLDVNSDIVQQGNQIRISADLSEQAGEIWMRIITSTGLIVQKAGLVKSKATGFQILIGTQNLKPGKYIIQVSNHREFSPLGVVPFEVKGKSPALLLAPFPLLAASLFNPETDEEFKFVIYRTMGDTRVDDECKKFENKKFKQGKSPNPPIHFGCRCFLEGTDE